MEPIKENVLNAGYIYLIDFMGGDEAVIRGARRCYRSESKGEQADRKLIRHLITAEHKSPFEHSVFAFDVKCPLFVARQWIRHRHASISEESLRYCIAERDYFIPTLPSQEMQSWIRRHESDFDYYDYIVNKLNVPKEQARAKLPTGIYTKFYWTINGSSLMNFLKLRQDSHAQPEIRAYANSIMSMVKHVSPMCFEEFEKIVILKDKG